MEEINRIKEQPDNSFSSLPLQWKFLKEVLSKLQF